jgi:23S rRNA pseudouridine2604 synthase
MADTPRKPLGLPPRGQSTEAPASTDRRPVRGGAPKRKTAAEVAQTNAAYAAKARALQEKPRGTPSRAPVVPKSPLAVRKSPAAPVTEKGSVQSGVRISKLMAERGLCSRRDADGYIERGWVFVDGLRVTELGTRADPSVNITLAREAQIQQTWQMTILLHKPVGYVSGQPEPGFTPAVTLIQPENQFATADTPAFHPRHLKGLAPAGRLDIDSTGLLVLTQDGRVARQLIGEDSQVDKEYLVRVEGRLDAAGLALLNHGLSLDNRQLKPAKVEWLNEDQLRFVLREGRKRQIRRMCELVGLHVVGLKRVRIGAVKLSDLPLGQWRFLREDERF